MKFGLLLGEIKCIDFFKEELLNMYGTKKCKFRTEFRKLHDKKTLLSNCIKMRRKIKRRTTLQFFVSRLYSTKITKTKN